MNRAAKLILDIVMGTVIPILILNNLNEQLGTVGAYVAAALVPVAWVLADLLFITKRFNFITSYVGASAIVSGLLAFWFVDGIRYAFKDTVGSVFTLVVFSGSMFLGKPIMHYFLAQAFQPETPQQEQMLNELFLEPQVARAVFQGTLLVLMTTVLTGVTNFILNFRIVTAGFGTILFNQQVARVNAITRIALTIPGLLGFVAAIVLIRRAMSLYLPEEEEGEKESDLWDLLQLREDQKARPSHLAQGVHSLDDTLRSTERES